MLLNSSVQRILGEFWSDTNTYVKNEQGPAWYKQVWSRMHASQAGGIPKTY